MYKIRGIDQKEYGPVSADIVRQWIADRRANGQTLVQAEGSPDWKQLAQFPEFADALAANLAAPGVGPRPAGTAYGPAADAKTSRLAIASLVLGFIGFLCLPALIGIILGVVAQIKIGKSNGQLKGSGLAIAGICLSAFMLVLAVPAGLLLPALSQAKGRAQSINCVSNLKQIGLGARMFANDHNDVFPTSFVIMSNELVSPKILVCSGDTKKVKATDWSMVTAQNISYEMVSPGMKEDSTAVRKTFVRCPNHGHVCYGDGSVQQGRPK